MLSAVKNIVMNSLPFAFSSPSDPPHFFSRYSICSVEKKKAELLLMETEKKREKVRRDVGRLEKNLADLSKDLQGMATPSKLFVSFLVMAIMFVVNRT